MFIFVARHPLPFKKDSAPKNSVSVFSLQRFLKKLCFISGKESNFGYRFYYLSSSCFIKQFLYVIFSTDSFVIYINYLFTRLPSSSTDQSFIVQKMCRPPLTRMFLECLALYVFPGTYTLQIPFFFLIQKMITETLKKSYSKFYWKNDLIRHNESNSIGNNTINKAKIIQFLHQEI